MFQELSFARCCIKLVATDELVRCACFMELHLLAALPITFPVGFFAWFCWLAPVLPLEAYTTSASWWTTGTAPSQETGADVLMRVI
jgi:hypothetical protein